MDLPRRLMQAVFLESFAAILVERGIYFYSKDLRGFTDSANLALAAVFGACYVVGALLSHPLSLRVRERKLALLAIGGQAAVHLGLAGWNTPVALFIGTGLLALMNGVKWPVIESFVSAGYTPTETARAIGRFNVCWSSAVPLALASVGPIIAVFSSGLFLLAAGLNVAAMWFLLPVPAHPVHLALDHPERPPELQLRRLRGLLVCSRWQMLANYALLWVLSALVPGAFKKLGVPIEWATPLWALPDVLRLGAFITLQHYKGWHARPGLLVGSLLTAPAGFLLVLLAPNVGVVVLGEVLFGFAAGVTYHNALYYAMVVKNASVDAGGAHEGLIGMGFFTGPVAGLAGTQVDLWFGTHGVGLLLGVGVLMAVCSSGAILPLLKLGPRSAVRDPVPGRP